MKIAILHSSLSKTTVPSGEKIVANIDVESLQDIADVHYYGVEELLGEHSSNSIINMFRIFFSFKLFFNLRKIITEKSITIVHIHGIFPHFGPTVFWAAKSKGIKVVQTLHNARWFCIEGGLSRNGSYCERCIKKTSFWGVIFGCTQGSKIKSLVMFLFNVAYVKTGLIFKLVDKFIAVSDFVNQYHVKAGFPKEKIITKYNRVYIPKMKELVPYEKRSGLVYAGRISWSKGAGVLAYLIQHLNEKINIVGKGDQLEVLKDYVRQNNIKNVFFHESLSRKASLNIIKNSLCLVAPSQCGETFGLSAAEATSYSVPVVCSKLGGLAEMIQLSNGGVSVPPSDFHSFYLNIKKIMENETIQKQYGDSGYAFAKENIDVETNGKALLEIYHTLG